MVVTVIIVKWDLNYRDKYNSPLNTHLHRPVRELERWGRSIDVQHWITMYVHDIITSA